MAKTLYCGKMDNSFVTVSNQLKAAGSSMGDRVFRYSAWNSLPGGGKCAVKLRFRVMRRSRTLGVELYISR